MIPDLPPNFTTRPYRGLSVQEVDVELTEPTILELLIGREVYRRTDYLLLEGREGWALVAVEKASTVPLFSPVVDARVLALPDQIVMIHDPEIDVGNASALAAAAWRNRRADALAYVVRGRFEHMNFIWKPEQIVVRVTEVVPPLPPKLLVMAEQVRDFDEDLPPVHFELDAVDIVDLTATSEAGTYLLPCRGSGADVDDAAVAYLDTRPAVRLPWVMLGCERSEQFHEHFYGDRAPRIDLCPRRRQRHGDGLTLTKCCLIERGVVLEEREAVVPWGSNLDEVRHALRCLLGLAEVPRPAVVADIPWQEAPVSPPEENRS